MVGKLFETPPARVSIAGTLDTMSELTSDSCIVDIVRLDPKLPVPVRAHAGDAGVDLYSAETVVLEPGQRVNWYAPVSRLNCLLALWVSLIPGLV